MMTQDASKTTMKTNWNLFHVAFITNVVVLVYCDLHPAWIRGEISRRIIITYVLLSLAGVIALVLWRKLDKYAVRLERTQKYSSTVLVISRNIATFLLGFLWDCLFCSFSISHVRFGAMEVIISVGIGSIVVGVITWIYWRRKLISEERESESIS